MLFIILQDLYRGWWLFFLWVILPLFVIALVYIIFARLFIKPSLDEGEQITNQAIATHVVGAVETTGKLFLTTNKLYYNSYKRSKADEVVVPLSNVKGAESIGSDTDSNFQVNLKDGSFLVFSLWSRSKWISRLNQLAG